MAGDIRKSTGPCADLTRIEEWLALLHRANLKAVRQLERPTRVSSHQHRVVHAGQLTTDRLVITAATWRFVKNRGCAVSLVPLDLQYTPVYEFR